MSRPDALWGARFGLSNPLTAVKDKALAQVRSEAAKGAREAVGPIVKLSIGLSAISIAVGIANLMKKGR